MSDAHLHQHIFNFFFCCLMSLTFPSCKKTVKMHHIKDIIYLMYLHERALYASRLCLSSLSSFLSVTLSLRPFGLSWILCQLNKNIKLWVLDRASASNNVWGVKRTHWFTKNHTPARCFRGKDYHCSSTIPVGFNNLWSPRPTVLSRRVHKTIFHYIKRNTHRDAWQLFCSGKVYCAIYMLILSSKLVQKE